MKTLLILLYQRFFHPNFSTGFLTIAKTKKVFYRFFQFFLFLFLVSCSEKMEIVSNVDEREANLIIVFLQSRGIDANKEAQASQMGSQDASQTKYNIRVDKKQSVEAMTLLNQNGLPKRPGPNLLSLFAKSGLMSSDKEENIRYQAGLAQQIQNTILMIDGVIDASVQISFPTQEGNTTTAEPILQRITAAVFVKHQGVVDDPNSHLESKIKRLVAGSVNGLDINDVTVVSDRSRLNDIGLMGSSDLLGGYTQDYVKVWSIIMTKESAAKFRALFFLLLFIALFALLFLGWTLFKVYPTIKSNGGFSELFNPVPFFKHLKKQVMAEEEKD